MAQIKPRLQPLGDGGYKIIPSNVISRFGQAPVQELRAAIEAAFTRRLNGYRELTERISAQRIDYLEFDNLVSMLKPMASPEVQRLIEKDQRDRKIAEIITFAGLLLIDLLSIVFPPLIPVAGMLHVANGIDQSIVGRDRANATGAHDLMSRERQESGPMMQVAGTVEAFGGALQVGMSVGGLGSRAGGCNRWVDPT
jgi:hypothetical protein